MKYFAAHRASSVKIVLLWFFITLVPIHSYAKDVSFKWTANPEPLTGYKFYYKIGTNGGPPYDGTSLSGGSSPIFLDKKTTYTIKGLSPDETYQFTITAYNGAEESGYSTVLTVSGDSSLRPTIINITMQ